MNKTIGFIGFGLIAGSIAKAIRKAHPEYTMCIYNRKHPVVSSSFELAVNDGTINTIYSSLEDFKNCDVIFLCAPVLTNISYLEHLKNIIKKDCILTDVGSVKGNIHKAVSEAGLDKNFIGGHPMTGSDRTGYENSSELFMENAYYLLTPSNEAAKEDIDYMYTLVKEMGSIAYIIDYDKHDEVTAAISHLPHIIASSLVNTVSDNDDAEEHMKTFAAGGFKDITRIASSSPEMWQSIFLSNPEHIVEYIDKFTANLNLYKEAIINKNSDTLYNTFEKSKDYRDSITASGKGPIAKAYEIYVDLPDVPGIIAIIATILSSNSVNIKNIGIVHNREFEQGVLKIEFYNEKDSQDAREALSKYPYPVYDR